MLFLPLLFSLPASPPPLKKIIEHIRKNNQDRLDSFMMIMIMMVVELFSLYSTIYIWYIIPEDRQNIFSLPGEVWTPTMSYVLKSQENTLNFKLVEYSIIGILHFFLLLFVLL